MGLCGIAMSHDKKEPS